MFGFLPRITRIFTNFYFLIRVNSCNSWLIFFCGLSRYSVTPQHLCYVASLTRILHISCDLSRYVLRITFYDIVTHNLKMDWITQKPDNGYWQKAHLLLLAYIFLLIAPAFFYRAERLAWPPSGSMQPQSDIQAYITGLTAEALADLLENPLLLLEKFPILSGLQPKALESLVERAVIDNFLRRLGDSATGKLLLDKLYNNNDIAITINLANQDLSLPFLKRTKGGGFEFLKVHPPGTGGGATWEILGRPTILLNKTELIRRLRNAAAVEAGVEDIDPHPGYQSKETVLNYTAAILGHELFHVAIGDHNIPFGDYRNLADGYHVQAFDSYVDKNGQPQQIKVQLSYRIAAKIVNELFYNDDPRNYTNPKSILRIPYGEPTDPRGLNYHQLNQSDALARQALSEARPNLRIPWPVAIELVSVRKAYLPLILKI